MDVLIEGNLDFKNAIYIDIINNVSNEICLLSHQQLTKSHIKLPCTHSFNYIPLFNEVSIQKTIKNSYETTRLRINQMKCPYCRTVFDNIMPYIPSESQEKKLGVNYPMKYCMEYNIHCDWSKKRKCTKNAMYIGEEFSYCKTHYLLAQQQHKAQQQAQHKDKASPVIWTDEMTVFYKSKTLIECKQILRQLKLKVSGNKQELVERIFTNKI